MKRIEFALRADYSGVLDRSGRYAGDRIALRCAKCGRILSGRVAVEGEKFYCGGCG